MITLAKCVADALIASGHVIFAPFALQLLEHRPRSKLVTKVRRHVLSDCLLIETLQGCVHFAAMMHLRPSVSIITTRWPSLVVVVIERHLGTTLMELIPLRLLMLIETTSLVIVSEPAMISVFPAFIVHT